MGTVGAGEWGWYVLGEIKTECMKSFEFKGLGESRRIMEGSVEERRLPS